MSFAFFGAGFLLIFPGAFFALVLPEKEVTKGHWVATPDWKVAALLLLMSVVCVAVGAVLSHMRWEWKS